MSAFNLVRWGALHLHPDSPATRAERNPLLAAFACLLITAGVMFIGAAVSSRKSQATVVETPRHALVAHPLSAAAVNADAYSGEVRARFESQLGFRVGGKIKARLVDLGTRVEAGALLAELDPLDLQLQVASANAALVAARASRDLAQADLDRYKLMLDRHFISPSQFDAQSNAVKSAEAKVRQAEAALAIAQNQSEYTRLKADSAGVVTAIHAEAGQVVAAGQTIATVARQGSLEVEIAVPENRIAAHPIGAAVEIEPWADSSERLAGRVREISPAGDRATHTYRLRVSFDDDAQAPYLGQTARVYFVDPGLSIQTLIPASALCEVAGEHAVWVVDAHTSQVHLKPVTVAAFKEQNVLLRSGVSTQEWIITAGVHRLQEGQAIAPIDAQNRDLRL
jgi:membrane fusion protein, multidrug efflux system